MTFSGFIIFIFVTLLVQHLAILVVGLEQEVFVTDGDIIECRLLGKLGFQFSFEVVVNRRLHILVGHDGSGEQPYIVEHIRILLGDVHGVVTTHRETGNGTPLLVGLCAVSLVDEFHHVGESGLERAFHRLGQIHVGSGKAQ